MNKNIVVIDVDVEFRMLLGNMSRSSGYVTTEYYYEVDDKTFDELGRTDVFYSESEGDRTVLDILGTIKPFDGISSGNASLARKDLDIDGRDGHARKMHDAFAKVGDVGRVLRICHTKNLFQQSAGCIRMFCRSFYVDPVTLEQTIANPGPKPPVTPLVPLASKPDHSRLFEFLAVRKEFHQTADVAVTYTLKVLAPTRDYDTTTMTTVVQGSGFDEARNRAVEWVKDALTSGELAIDRSILKVVGREYGNNRKHMYEGAVVFIDRKTTQAFGSGLDQVTIAFAGKKLPVRKSQPLSLFKIIPVTARNSQYRLAESEMIEFWAHMLDEATEA